MAPAGEPEQGVPADNLVADSDAELVRRIAEEDLAAFEILYRRYVRAVYGLAVRLLRDPGRAEGATGDAFAAIWRCAATYVPEPSGAARWLFTVAREAIVDDASRESAAEDSWPAFRVHAAVAELPEGERVPIELTYWEGRSRNEIADLLGLPRGTVETRTRGALARLAARLGDSDEQTET